MWVKVRNALGIINLCKFHTRLSWSHAGARHGRHFFFVGGGGGDLNFNISFLEKKISFFIF